MCPADPWDEDDEDEDNEPKAKAPPARPSPASSLSLSARAASSMQQQQQAPAPRPEQVKGTVPLPHFAPRKGGTGELTADDITEDTIIGPGAAFATRGYQSSARMNPRHLAVAESAARDALALQSAEKRDVLTATFAKNGINWNAGYTSELGQTPLGHGMTEGDEHELPGPGQMLRIDVPQKKSSLVAYAVNPHLQAVLEPLLPVAFRNAMVQARGQRTLLREICIYYLPAPVATSAGFIHEYLHPRDHGKRFYFYVQTTVGVAPEDVLDQILESLSPGLPEGEDPADFSVEPEVVERRRLTDEVEDSIRQVSQTLQGSAPVRAFQDSVHKAADAGQAISGFLDNVDTKVAKSWKKFRRWMKI